MAYFLGYLHMVEISKIHSRRPFWPAIANWPPARGVTFTDDHRAATLALFWHLLHPFCHGCVMGKSHGNYKTNIWKFIGTLIAMFGSLLWKVYGEDMATSSIDWFCFILYSYLFDLFMWETENLSFLWFRDFQTCPWAPKPILFIICLSRHQDTQHVSRKIPDHFWEILIYPPRCR